MQFINAKASSGALWPLSEALIGESGPTGALPQMLISKTSQLNRMSF